MGCLPAARQKACRLARNRTSFPLQRATPSRRSAPSTHSEDSVGCLQLSWAFIHAAGWLWASVYCNSNCKEFCIDWVLTFPAVKVSRLQNLALKKYMRKKRVSCDVAVSVWQLSAVGQLTVGQLTVRTSSSVLQLSELDGYYVCVKSAY